MGQRTSWSFSVAFEAREAVPADAAKNLGPDCEIRARQGGSCGSGPVSTSGHSGSAGFLTSFEQPLRAHREFLALGEVEAHRAFKVILGHPHGPALIIGDGNQDIANIERIAGAEFAAAVGKA